MTQHVVIVGGGQMGGALVGAVLAAGYVPGQVYVVEPHQPRAAELIDQHHINAGALADVVPGAAIVVLAIKPGAMGMMLSHLAPLLDAHTLVVSVAAGVPLSVYETALPDGTPVVRVMPNTPALIGKGAAAVAPGRNASAQDLAAVEKLLAATGLVVQVEEKDLDAVTAVSGSGPAYAFYLIDAMAEAGVLLGLNRDLATRLAVATVEGAGALAAHTGDHPAVLRERVSSPSGTTIAAIAELDERGVRGAVVQAVQAAYTRSRELGGN